LYASKKSTNKATSNRSNDSSLDIASTDQLPPSEDGTIQDWWQRVQYELNHENSEMVTKTLNGLFLVMCFGFALYTIVTIDHDITRGWTHSEIVRRIPLDNWASYETALAEKPVATKTTINVIIYLLGDWLSQTVFQKRNVLEFDVKRTLRNGFIGLCFGPLVHMYYEWSDSILPVEAGITNRISKIIMDQTLYLSIKCSIYIAAVGLLQGDSVATVKDTIQTRIGPICFTAWKFWPLVHCLTYSVVPARHRILWVNCVDLVWNAILAAMARPVVEEEELPPVMVEVVEMVSHEESLHETVPTASVLPSVNATLAEVTP
jgi:protein Mpv17